MEKNQYYDGRYLSFGATALRLAAMFAKGRIGAHVGDQLSRSATSVGAHLQEARAAESRADFVHKLQIALKEMREARYWLALAQEAKIYEGQELSGLFEEADQLVAILTRSVITAKTRSGLAR